MSAPEVVRAEPRRALTRGRATRGRGRDGEDEAAGEFTIPLAPLVDVVFLLLVFFLVATNFIDREKDLTVSLPRGSGAAQAGRLERLLVNVRSDGTVLLGARPVSREELYRALVEAVRANPSLPVVLRGDKTASHGEIVGVLDVCTRARVKTVAVAVSPLPAEGPGGAAQRTSGLGDVSPSPR